MNVYVVGLTTAWGTGLAIVAAKSEEQARQLALIDANAGYIKSWRTDSCRKLPVHYVGKETKPYVMIMRARAE